MVKKEPGGGYALPGQDVRPDALTPTLSHRERVRTQKTVTPVTVLLLPRSRYRAIFSIPARNIRKLRVQHFRQVARRQLDIQPAFAAGYKDGFKLL